MGSWENDFSKRVAAIRDSSSGQFSDLASNEIVPAFNTMKSFVETGGFIATVQQGTNSLQTYRFSLSDDIFVDIHYALVGPGAVRSSFHINTPCSVGDDDLVMEHISLSTLTEGWAKQQFRTALDALMNDIEKMTVSEGGMKEEEAPTTDAPVPVEGAAFVEAQAAPPTTEAPAPPAEPTPAPTQDLSTPAVDGKTKEAA